MRLSAVIQVNAGLMIFALIQTQSSLALPPSAPTSADCETAAVSLDVASVASPRSPALTTNDLTSFIDESFKDPSLVFRQPFNGCEARAHVMAQRLLERGAKVRKIFAGGRLLARGRDGNYYRWKGHVALTVEITDTVGGRPVTRERVIDPALFDHPVTEAEWKAAVQIGDSSKADISYGPSHLYGPPSGLYLDNPSYYDRAAKASLSALTKLDSLPPEAQKDFQTRMRVDPALNVAWDSGEFMQRWGDPVFRRAWMEDRIKPGPGQDDYDFEYWKNWRPPN